MKEELVSFNVAKLAKEKGFDIEVHHCWMITLDKKNRIPYLERDIEFEENFNSKEFEKPEFIDSEIGVKYSRISAPTQGLLQRWLRGVHNIHIVITPEIVWTTTPITYFAYILSSSELQKHQINNGFDTYEEMLEQSLYEALKLIK